MARLLNSDVAVGRPFRNELPFGHVASVIRSDGRPRYAAAKRIHRAYKAAKTGSVRRLRHPPYTRHFAHSYAVGSAVKVLLTRAGMRVALTGCLIEIAAASAAAAPAALHAIRPEAWRTPWRRSPHAIHRKPDRPRRSPAEPPISCASASRKAPTPMCTFRPISPMCSTSSKTTWARLQSSSPATACASSPDRSCS